MVIARLEFSFRRNQWSHPHIQGQDSLFEFHLQAHVTLVFFFFFFNVSQANMERKTNERARAPKAWIREGTEEEPVDFLDPGVVQRVVGKSVGAAKAFQFESGKRERFD